MAFALSVETVAQWLQCQGVATDGMRFTALGGGVSNEVVLAESLAWRGVLKQSLPKLRVDAEWLSDRSRILREAAAMGWLEGKLTPGRTPRLLFEDSKNWVIAMEAAPDGARMWKDLLLGGEIQPSHARTAGEMLASMIAASLDDPAAREIFGDQAVFRQLRIDPYYRFTAARHPELAGWFQALIDRSANRAMSLVHGDWSPKNLLVAGGDMWVIDWEAIHFGDPSFDAAFLLNHLLLKTIARPQYAGALAGLAHEFVQPLPGWVREAAMEHLPALLLARVDGKSPAEYLDGTMRQHARDLAIHCIRSGGCTLEELFPK